MKRILLIGLAFSLFAPPAMGQTTVPPYRFIIRPDSAIQKPIDVKVRDLGSVVKRSPETDHMKAALRDLITGEEAYFAAHDTYTTDAKALEAYFTQHGQAQTHVTFASREGWTGTATEPSLKGKNCVIYMGFVKSLPNGAPKTLGGIVPKGAGIPTCDEP
jgi:hypothetical protein